MALLSRASVSTLMVPGPGYDRDAASVGIVHFGVGNFHRSHQAMYLDRLMARGLALDWGICGVGVMPQDSAMHAVTKAQDCLYTLVVRNPDGSLEPRVIGSMLKYLLAPEDPEAVWAALVDPAVRIVSLTVTEGGYLENPATGDFDAGHPAVAADLADPQHPGTVFGYLVEGLRRRREAGVEPFTVLSCDNLQGNGRHAGRAVVGLARLADAPLADWIARHVSFPNCMVDRITPATTDADRQTLARRFGVQDGWPVPTEPFTQWIIEDCFPLGRPPLEAVGVQFVPDVTPYELMKLRLLNATHQALAYLGASLGYRLVDEAMQDGLVRAYLRAYMEFEAAPTLGPLEGIDLEAYMATLLERYSSPHMRDTLVRLATDGSNRMPTFTLPTIRDNLAAGRPIRLGAAMVAAWAHYWALIGRGEIAGEQVPDDVHAAEMTAAAADPDPAAFLELRSLLGDLGDEPRFRAAFLDVRGTLVECGVAAALIELLGTR